MIQVMILDTETTGTDEAAVCIEVAVARYDLAHGLEACYSSLVRADGNPAIEVNGIPTELVAHAAFPDTVWGDAESFGFGCAAIVAHGADFDQRFVPPGFCEDEHTGAPIPWICSMDDIEWPKKSSSKALAAICLAHGVGVEAAHRAIADVMLLVRLFDRMREQGRDLRAMIERAMRPKGLFVVADGRYDPIRNTMAKEAGFRWDPERKRWWRRMFVDLAAALPFAVRRADE